MFGESTPWSCAPIGDSHRDRLRLIATAGMTRVFANGDHGSDRVGGRASIWNSRMAGSTWLRRY
jgi:hypothetical protein